MNGPHIYNFGPESDVVFRRTQYGSDADLTVNLASGNGVTPFGKVQAGTPVGKMTAGTKTGYYRPCGRPRVSGDQSSVNEILCQANEHKTLFVGDVVSIVRPSTGATIVSARTVSDINRTTHKVTVSGAAVTVKDGDYFVVDNCPTPKGVMAKSVTTTDFDRAEGTLVERDSGALLARAADAYSARLTAWNALVAAELPTILTD